MRQDLLEPGVIGVGNGLAADLWFFERNQRTEPRTRCAATMPPLAVVSRTPARDASTETTS